MTYDLEYRGQNLSNRSKKATHDFAIDMMKIMSRRAGIQTRVIGRAPAYAVPNASPSDLNRTPGRGDGSAP